jgi:hypothetical protein
MLTARGERTPAHLALAARAAALAPDSFIAQFNYASALMRAVQPSRDAFMQALGLAETDEQTRLGSPSPRPGSARRRGFHPGAALVRVAGECANKSAAIAKLAGGNLHDGLTEFEVKYHKPPRKPISESGIPRWKGEDIEGKTLILAHEQGFGDTLQFIRFAPRCER